MSHEITNQSTSERIDLESPDRQDSQFGVKIFPTTEPFYPQPQIKWRLIIWSVLGSLVVIGLIYSLIPLSPRPEAETTLEQPRIAIPVSPTAPPTPTTTPTPTRAGTTLAADFTIAAEIPFPPPVPEGRILVLRTGPREVGWVVSDDPTIITAYDPQNHFGDSFLHAGTLEGKIYHGAILFDLSRIPRGTEIHAARLRLTGLRADRLGETGEWQVHILDPEIDARWYDHNYEQIHNARSLFTLIPSLTPEQLGEGQINVFDFTPEQLAHLERRIFEGNDQFGRTISFRLDGPMTDVDNLFAWDSGYGPTSKGPGSQPELIVSLGPPPAETPPPYYVMITSTPTPENIMTAVANSIRLTEEARQFGTATPLPAHWVTPFVVTATPTPENQSTARAMSTLAIAMALTTGEPPNVATATPTPTYVIITSTPTPENVMTAAAEALQVTAEAIQFGTATPFPANWVTPAVVTASPTPANSATAGYVRAVALTTGTPTPTPGNVQTATPTPIFITVEPFPSPTTTATPSPTPQTIPEVLLGKIIFLSDREGATEEERARVDMLRQAGVVEATPQITPQPYVFDPETKQLARLTDMWPYEVAVKRDAWSADATRETYTQELLWTNIRTGYGNIPTEVFAIHYYDHLYKVERIVTEMGAGIVYDPVWSPVNNEIAFVATESGNDEIWVINYDGADARQLTRNEWEWDKHPSWSPDGQEIVFFSNRTGNNQLWIMNKDGQEQRLLMDWTAFNDWNPVWIKYINPAPPLEREPDWRFIKPEEETPVAK